MLAWPDPSLGRAVCEPYRFTANAAATRRTSVLSHPRLWRFHRRRDRPTRYVWPDRRVSVHCRMRPAFDHERSRTVRRSPRSREPLNVVDPRFAMSRDARRSNPHIALRRCRSRPAYHGPPRSSFNPLPASFAPRRQPFLRVRLNLAFRSACGRLVCKSWQALCHDSLITRENPSN